MSRCSARGRADVKRNLEREADVVSRYLSGETLDAIAKDYVCHRSNIDRIIRLSGVERGGNRRRTVSAAGVVESYMRGATLAQVGEEFGVSSYVVTETLEAAGVPRRSRGPRPTGCTARPVVGGRR